jgi:hypothetical protein
MHATTAAACLIDWLQARTASCQRTFSTAAALAAMCNDATSPLSATYWSGLEFPPRPGAQQTNPVTVTSLARRDLATGAWTALDPAADLQDPTAAAGPPVACAGVSRTQLPMQLTVRSLFVVQRVPLNC